MPDECHLASVLQAAIGGLLDGRSDGPGVGFSDRGVAQRLAHMPLEAWGPVAERAAYEFAVRYRSQLATIDVDVDAFAAPAPMEAGALKALRSLWAADGRLVLAFAFDEALHLAVRRLPGRVFDRDSKTWLIDATSTGCVAVSELCARFDIPVAPSARALIDTVGRAPTEPAAPAAAGSAPAPAVRPDKPPAAPRPPRPPEAGERRIELAGKRFAVIFPFDPELKDLVKKLPGHKWDDRHRRWTVAGSAKGARALQRFADRHAFEFAPDAAERLEAVIGTGDAIAAQLAVVAASRPERIELKPFQRTPRPFQREAIDCIADLKRVLLADEPGLGKTITSLGALHKAAALPAVVVCPASLRSNWRAETQEGMPDVPVALIDSETPDPARLVGALLAIVSYDVLPAWWETLAGWRPRALVFDESHAVKEHDSQRTRAAVALADEVRADGGVVVLASATPLKNRPKELLPQLEILGVLELFGGREQFLHRFCGPKPSRFAKSGFSYDGASNLAELNGLLRQICMIRRRKRDVLPQLPPLQPAPVLLELPSRALAEYRRAEADIFTFVRSRAHQRAESQALIDGLSSEHAREIAARHAAAAVGAATRAPGLVALSTLRELAGLAKTAAIIDWTREFLGSGEKLVLYAVHQRIQQRLLEAFPDCARVLGGQRDVGEQVRRFQTDPDCRLFLGSVAAAREGLTLTAASNVALAELPWTPLEVDQVAGRVYGRLNDAHGATLWYLLADGTLDPTTLDVIDSKRAIADLTLDGSSDESFAASTVLDELLSRLHAHAEQLPLSSAA